MTRHGFSTNFLTKSPPTLLYPTGGYSSLSFAEGGREGFWDLAERHREGMDLVSTPFRGDVRVPTTILMKSNVSLSRGQGSEMVLPSSVRNLEDLLRHIGEEIDFVFLDAQTGKLRPDIDILVNGKEIWFYPEGLKRPVLDRDAVEITLIPLGGG